MPCYGVYQGAVKVAHSRVNHEACRLVDDHQLIVFVYHVQGDVLWLDGRIVVRAVEHQCHHIARAHLIITLNRFPVDVNEPCISSFLDAVARGVLHVFRHVLVDAHRFLAAVHLHAQVLIKLTVALFVEIQRDVVQFVRHEVYSPVIVGSVTTSNSSTCTSSG